MYIYIYTYRNENVGKLENTTNKRKQGKTSKKKNLKKTKKKCRNAEHRES